MDRFCAKCGEQLSSTGVCPKCGSPQQESAAQTNGQMKKTGSTALGGIIVIVLLFLIIRSCGSNTSQNNNSTATITPSSAGILSSSSGNGHYLSIKDYSISEDHKTLFGDKYIEFIVYYEWTNNGTSATSASSALPEIRVFQDGYECRGRGYGENNYHKNIRPGDTLGFYLNYELFDASSDVVVKVDNNQHIAKTFIISSR